MPAATAEKPARKKSTAKAGTKRGRTDNPVRQPLAEPVAHSEGGQDCPPYSQNAEPERDEFIRQFEEKPGIVRDIPVGALHPSPFQPREWFDPVKLAELAARLQSQGQLTDLLVRHRGDGSWEILAGERRWRAAKLIKKPTLSCKVIDCTDAEARKKAAFENLGREDLTPIEEIRAYRDLLDADVNLSQIALAKSLGMDPATLSNKLRVLELPEPWLLWISQEKFGLTVTHSRPLLKWIHRPQVLKTLADQFIKEYGLNADGTEDATRQETEGDDVQRHDSEIRYTVVEIEQNVHGAAKHVSRPLKGYDHWHAKGQVLLTPKQCKDEDLEVDKVGSEQRAFNVELWQKYQTEGVGRRDKAAAKSISPASRGGRSDQTTEEPDPAAAEARAAEKAEQRNKKLYRYRIQTLQDRIGARLEENGLTDADALRIALWFQLHHTDYNAMSRRQNVYFKHLTECGARLINDDAGRPNCWRMSLMLDDEMVGDAVRGALIELVSLGAVESRGDLPPEFIEQLAQLLQVKFETDWKPTTEFLKLLSMDDLWALDNTWSTHLAEKDHSTKDNLIEGLLASDAKKPMPTMLKTVKAVPL